MKLTKVLVTGAGGFLGSYIARDLITAGYEVYSFSRGRYDSLEKMGVTQRFGNLSNYDDVEVALLGMDAVIHTASLVGMWGLYEDFYKTNVTGTENVIRACHHHHTSRLVYTSTPSVAFGDKNLCNVDESIGYPEKYLSMYAETKAIAEKMVLMANGGTLSTVAIRPHLIFGPGDLNLVPRVVEAAKAGRLKIIGTGENLVDVTYVENASMAHVMALEQLNSFAAIAGKAYFLGQGPIKLWDFTNELLKRSGVNPITKKISFKAAYIIGFIIESFLKMISKYDVHPPMTRFVALQLGKSHYYNHAGIEKDLGFVPKYSIEEGLDKLFLKSEVLSNICHLNK